MLATALVAMTLTSAPARAGIYEVIYWLQIGDIPNAINELLSRSTLDSAVIEYQRAMALYGGAGGQQDLAEAARWFRLAALRGHPEAQFSLGEMHMAGAGVKLDPLEALRWYRKAAGRGNTKAMRSLSMMAWRGIGIPRSFVLSYALQTLIERTDPTSRDEVLGTKMDLERLMRKADIQQAVALAGELGTTGNFLSAFDGHLGSLR